jgi:hypothetical protein
VIEERLDHIDRFRGLGMFGVVFKDALDIGLRSFSVLGKILDAPPGYDVAPLAGEQAVFFVPLGGNVGEDNGVENHSGDDLFL